MRHALRWSLASLLVTGFLAACGGSSTPPPAPTCTDGLKNGAETGTDCGGTACPRCADGQACADLSDCLSGACAAGTCRSPDCSDGVKNGAETAMDCGGTCAPCADGLACSQRSDCLSDVCSSGICAAPTCLDGVKNGAEAGTDCGGDCPGCLDGGPCARNSDCGSGLCQAGTCRPATCGDLARDGAETDVDCGGADCAPCDLGKTCAAGADCGSGACQVDVCRPAHCGSGAKDGDETSLDCGGACAPCPAGSACTVPADCISGACASSVCLKSAGEACGGDTECVLGFCTDGVCCAARCGGVCEACNGPGRAGFCDPVPAGQDPADECSTDAPSSCQRTGACSGGRSCALYPAGTACGTATCAAGIASIVDTCSGAGSCVDSGTQSCFPYLCDATATACLASCSSNGHCAAGYACSGGLCKKAQGAACGSDGECTTGFCTDGSCCEARCGGTCEKCSQAGRAGFCDAVAAGADPDNECADLGASSCGTTGLCSGARSCALYASSTVCAAASCATATSSSRADLCSGAGTCVDSGIVDCTPYACSGASGSCRSTCAIDAECASGHACAAGVCKRATGGACTSGIDCASNACCSSVCRDLAADAANCGTCGTVCQTSAGTSSNACVSSSCTPVCNGPWNSCDGNPANGCETPTSTLSDCGGCGIVCSRANATASCATGSCAIASCDPGWDSCDGNGANGCETSHATATSTCATAVDLGTTCGDFQYACGFAGTACCDSATNLLATRTGTSGGWFRVHVSECSSALACNGQLDLVLTLSVPPGIDYDLLAYSSCGTLLGSSTGGAGATEQVVVSRPDTSANDSFDVWIEVSYFGGSSCSPWSLAVTGKSPL